MTLDQARRLKEEILIAQDLGIWSDDDARSFDFDDTVITVTVPDEAAGKALPAKARNRTVKWVVGKKAT